MQPQKSVEPAHILIVEDDDDLAHLIDIQLGFQGHTLHRASSYQEAQQWLDTHDADLMVLDRGLPDGDGLNLLHQQQRVNVPPVLILSAQSDEKDKVAGLEAGAEDYLAKPFSVIEFQARVRAILRRQQKEAQHVSDDATAPRLSERQYTTMTDLGELCIEPQAHRVTFNAQPVVLTATEFALLAFLAKKPGRVYSKSELLSHVWETDYLGYQHTVCSTINRLRAKLEQHSSQRWIQTVWGVGYKFEPESKPI